MISKEKYIDLSLELHLFWARIMKEHSIFLEVGFTDKNKKLAKIADNYKFKFEKILQDVVKVSNGRIGQELLDSGEIITKYTLDAEKKTKYYTGIDINTKITLMENKLECKVKKNDNDRIISYIKNINNRAIKLLDGLIEFKIKILSDVLCCELFTLNYPMFNEHLIEEAKTYRAYIKELENNKDIEKSDIRKTELFLDEIMMEHALFIRGLLDPSENELIVKSNKFANEFEKLIKRAESITDDTKLSVTDDTLSQTIKLRDFKKDGTKGILECKIRSIILPLLSDHVIREANHYIRILKKYNK
ncbi:DUF2935 domain-containing protein [Clostridium sp.]|uniref:DUF2935 domain-containing protein n=1 Tax=Clostridium sp. TaxID=1506 RepID=UPI001DA0FC37|nr:DUF2935 domain-containing protein [Clostridium sp.]MBS5985013.1 DUF2935 domain-containing protein [Clostridium sp.]